MARLGTFDLNANPPTWWDVTRDVGGWYTEELVPRLATWPSADDDARARAYRAPVAEDVAIGARTNTGSIAWALEEPKQPRRLQARALDDGAIKSAATTQVTKALAAEDAAPRKLRAPASPEESHPFHPTYFPLRTLVNDLDLVRAPVRRQPTAPEESHPFHPSYSPLREFVFDLEVRTNPRFQARSLDENAFKDVTIVVLSSKALSDETPRLAIVRPARAEPEAPIVALRRSAGSGLSEDATPRAKALPARLPEDWEAFTEGTFPLPSSGWYADELRRQTPRTTQAEDSTLLRQAGTPLFLAIEDPLQRAPRYMRAPEEAGALRFLGPPVVSSVGWYVDDALRRLIRPVRSADEAGHIHPVLVGPSFGWAAEELARFATVRRFIDEPPVLSAVGYALARQGWRSEDVFPKALRPARAADESYALRLLAPSPLGPSFGWADDALRRASLPARTDDGQLFAALTLSQGWRSEDPARLAAVRRIIEDAFALRPALTKFVGWQSDDPARPTARRAFVDEPAALSATGYALAIQGWRSEDPARFALPRRFPDDSQTLSALARSFGWASDDPRRRPFSAVRADDLALLGAAVIRSFGWHTVDPTSRRPPRAVIEEASFVGFLHYTHPAAWLLEDARRSPWRPATQPDEPWSWAYYRPQYIVLLVRTRPVDPVLSTPTTPLDPNLASATGTANPNLTSPTAPVSPVLPTQAAINPNLPPTRTRS